jgi:hypothetical protein
MYIGCVLTASLAFSFVIRQGVPEESPMRYGYALCGPALSLFTHMALPLFTFQSILVLPWLVLGAVSKRARLISVVGFIGSWLAIGWYMYDLF